jgi:hypothetical protein
MDQEFYQRIAGICKAVFHIVKDLQGA